MGGGLVVGCDGLVGWGVRLVAGGWRLSPALVLLPWASVLLVLPGKTGLINMASHRLVLLLGIAAPASAKHVQYFFGSC